MDLSAIVEALITASEDPLSAERIVELVHARAGELAEQAAEENSRNSTAAKAAAALEAVDATDVKEAIDGLNQDYDSTGRAFQLIPRSTGWKLYTRPDYADFVAQLFPGRRAERLSGPAMETLAIIAYRQPITKAAIEAVRGVGCDAMLQRLLDRELVRIAGRAELPGRPLLYETTGFFFEHFGIRSIDDLPNAGELRKAPLPEPEETAETTTDADASVQEQQLALGAQTEAESAPTGEGDDGPADEDTAKADVPAAEPASEPKPTPEQEL